MITSTLMMEVYNFEDQQRQPHHAVEEAYCQGVQEQPASSTEGHAVRGRPCWRQKKRKRNREEITQQVGRRNQDKVVIRINSHDQITGIKSIRNDYYRRMQETDPTSQSLTHAKETEADPREIFGY